MRGFINRKNDLKDELPLQIFIGFDRAESVAYHVCCQSILENSSRPVSFTPIGIDNVSSFFGRPRGDKDSTDFAITRFLTPYLCGFEGQALFMDCDMLVRGDVAELFASADPSKSISVVKHDSIPKTEKKFLGQEQTKYPMKNWSSVILFQNALCKTLTPDYVKRAHGLELHQFKWLDPSQIGTLDPSWNHLVGEYPRSDEAQILHYTLGGPYFDDYKDSDHAEDWFDYFSRASLPMKLDDETDH